MLARTQLSNQFIINHNLHPVIFLCTSTMTVALHFITQLFHFHPTQLKPLTPTATVTDISKLTPHNLHRVITNKTERKQCADLYDGKRSHMNTTGGVFLSTFNAPTRRIDKACVATSSTPFKGVTRWKLANPLLWPYLATWKGTLYFKKTDSFQKTAWQVIS